MPVRIDPSARKIGFKLASELVEEELIERARLAATTVESLAQIKREAEARRQLSEGRTLHRAKGAAWVSLRYATSSPASASTSSA